MKWYKFIFADGFVTYCAGLSAQERGALVREHGKLIAKVPA